MTTPHRGLADLEQFRVDGCAQALLHARHTKIIRGCHDRGKRAQLNFGLRFSKNAWKASAASGEPSLIAKLTASSSRILCVSARRRSRISFFVSCTEAVGSSANRAAF